MTRARNKKNEVYQNNWRDIQDNKVHRSKQDKRIIHEGQVQVDRCAQQARVKHGTVASQ
jgi:hypothetical protein